MSDRVIPADFTLRKRFALDDLPDVARVIEKGLVKAFTTKTYAELATAQVLDVAEEAGEFVGAFRRYSGLARRPGTVEELEDEWADVIIAAFSAAKFLGINPVHAIERKAAKVLSRGYKEGSDGPNA